MEKFEQDVLEKFIIKTSSPVKALLFVQTNL